MPHKFDEIDELAAALNDLSSVRGEHENEQLTPSGERPCPICGSIMQVEDYEGVEIDTCLAHGVWLDNRELMTIISRVRTGERVKRHRAIKDARRDGQLGAMALGTWALWIDD